MPASAGRLVLVSLLVALAGTARAASIDATYDMSRMLNEPHPLADRMGTRWRPVAPVESRAPMPTGAMPTGAMPAVPLPAGPLPAIQPAQLLPMPPGLPPSPGQPPAGPVSAGKAQAITPYLNLDDAGTLPAAQSPAQPAARPGPQSQAPSAARTVAQASPPQPKPATGRDRPAVTTAAAGRPAVRGAGDKFISEIRVGALAHDTGPFSRRKEEGIDANIEILFGSPGFLKVIGSPRPHIGADINTKGDTSDVYLGLSWEWEFWRYMFGGFSLGGAVHDGETTNAPVDRKELGCKVLFRESVELGFRFAERHSISAFLDHISNAKLCSTNEGLENVGIRYGYKF
jgi:lipid A 3-O-deacylase